MKSISLKEALLPQPPSFGKKKYYEIKDVLGTGSFGKVQVRSTCFASRPIPNALRVQRATWHVPPGQIPVAMQGAAGSSASPSTSPTLPVSRPDTFSRQNSNTSTSSFLSLSRNSSNSQQDSGMTVEVALKIIPKKKVKGNEDSVWGEMEVLKGLNHKNIVRPRYLPRSTSSSSRAFRRLNSMNGSNQEASTTFRSNWLSAESYSNASRRRASSQNPTPSLSCVRYCPECSTSTNTTLSIVISSELRPIYVPSFC